MRPKGFSRDVPTRWNSTYELLNDSNAYKELFCDFNYSVILMLTILVKLMYIFINEMHAQVLGYLKNF